MRELNEAEKFDIAMRFAALFRGRNDARGLVHGECRPGAVTETHWMAHLFWPEQSMGIYPMVREDDRYLVRWGCTDIDVGYETSLPMAKNLRRALKALGITGWIERSKGKGFHVWVFADGWVAAETMRKALLTAHQVAGVPPTEINPKQTSDGHLIKGYGNYVNLPYPYGWEGTGKRVVLGMHDITGDLSLGQFLFEAERTLTPHAALVRAAGFYKEPPKPKQVIVGEYDGELEPLVKRLNGLAYTIFVNGVLDGRDRSRTIQRLAHKCAESGLSPAEAMAIVMDADKRWGKYADRPDADRHYDTLIQNAYGRLDDEDETVTP